MASLYESHVNSFMERLRARNRGESEFLQAAHEVVESVMPFVLDNKAYQDANILERITEPDRIVSFRVSWQDDDGKVQVNRGYRIQFNNAIGPYKGGLRFHPSVNQSILKFLGFEQTFKNSLTTLPMGGGKGGSDFNPKGKSDAEVMRFCQSFMLELERHIGPDCDVPAGDIGVGAREIGYLFGQYKRLRNEHSGVLTGKGLQYGGSLIRTEATGYGLVYLAQTALEYAGESIAGKVCTVSGSGNVAQYATEKATALGGKVVTLSDSDGYVYDPEGIDADKLAWVKDLKNVRRGRIKEYAETFNATFVPKTRPWEVPCDIAMPCATQNELDGSDAGRLIDNGVFMVAEGANMPSTPEAIERLQGAGKLFLPGKASNAGGVSCSGLEMSQNSLRLSWTREEVDTRLQGIMQAIHKQCVAHGETAGTVDYVKGANLGGFIKVAESMMAYGVV